MQEGGGGARHRLAHLVYLFSYDNSARAPAPHTTKAAKFKHLIGEAVANTRDLRTDPPPVEVLLIPSPPGVQPRDWSSARSSLGRDSFSSKRANECLNPYTMQVTWRRLQQACPSLPSLGIPEDENIKMETLYQAFKVFASSLQYQYRTGPYDRHRPYPRRQLNLPALLSKEALRVTGRDVLRDPAFSEHLSTLLTHQSFASGHNADPAHLSADGKRIAWRMPPMVRRHWHNKSVPAQLGYMDPWDLEAPLSGYAGSRRAYARLYRLCYRSRPECAGIVWKRVRLVRTGHALLLIETDAAKAESRGKLFSATLESLQTQMQRTDDKMGHAVVLAWDVLNFANDERIARAKDIATVPLGEPTVPVPQVEVGWRALPRPGRRPCPSRSRRGQ